jgi:hypothetical protein
MAYSIPQYKKWNGGGYVQTSNSGSFTVTAGDTIILWIGKGLAGSWATPTDNLGNTYTLVDGGGTDNDAFLYYAKSITGGSCTITISSTPEFQDHSAIAIEVSGLDATAPFDVSAKTVEAGFNQSHPSGNTASPAQADNLVIGVVSTEANSAYTLGSGYANLQTQNGFDAFKSVAVQDKRITASAAQSSSMTTTGFDRGISICAVFKEAAVAADTYSGRGVGRGIGRGVFR